MTTATNVDVLIVGAGHNGLVAGAYLARAGRNVLVVEARDDAGGQLAPATYGRGFSAPLHASARLRPEIVRELDLARHGFAANDAESPYVAPLPDGGLLRLKTDATDPGTLESIRRLSARDAARWPEFVAYMNAAAAFLDAAYATAMPRLPHLDWRADGVPLASLAWKLRRLGRRDMFRVIRSLSMTAIEFTEEWFESEPLRAAVGALGLHGVTLGSMSAGAGYVLLHNWRNRGGLGHRGSADDAADLGTVLVKALRACGGVVRTGASVARILVEHQRCVGVQLASGEEIRARTVVSAADPRRTLLGLVGAPELPPEFVWHARSIRMRGSVAKVHVLTDGDHGLPAGTVVVAPTLKYLERAYDAAKYGEVAEQPYLEVTTAGSVVSIHVQFAPYALRHGDWASMRATLERRAIDTLASHFPAFRHAVRDVRSVTPLDLEQSWHLTEGDLNHGQLILDQVFFMRPMPGWSDHRTPVDGLWLCGSGVHGGGGISGSAGRNAARAILKARR
ncbi:MAG TPA: NAD(P)/FAD-dependent oxidoreductase [Steroidobacteraceae bacterium]|nr:NAD(P)/FAD-dependent oxidoreductase [Steroidobacteraceae bacterium]